MRPTDKKKPWLNWPNGPIQWKYASLENICVPVHLADGSSIEPVRGGADVPLAPLAGVGPELGLAQGEQFNLHGGTVLGLMWM